MKVVKHIKNNEIKILSPVIKLCHKKILKKIHNGSKCALQLWMQLEFVTTLLISITNMIRIGMLSELKSKIKDKE